VEPCAALCPAARCAECTSPHRVALCAAHARLSVVAGAAAARPASFENVPRSLLSPNDALDSLPGVDEFAVRTYHQLQRTCSSLLHVESFRAILGRPKLTLAGRSRMLTALISRMAHLRVRLGSCPPHGRGEGGGESVQRAWAIHVLARVGLRDRP
jgi:hypothetical protein